MIKGIISPLILKFKDLARKYIKIVAGKPKSANKSQSLEKPMPLRKIRTNIRVMIVDINRKIR